MRDVFASMKLSRGFLIAVLAAAASVALTYAATGPLGLIWDDYIVLRPRDWSELLRVWHGSWDLSGIVPTFYRPLAVWTDTAAYYAFGFNEAALRFIALAQLAIGAALFGEFVRREADSLVLGAFAAAAYAAHPVVSASAGPWWFEQNHRLAVICVAAALLSWQSRRTSLAWISWWPAHAWILAGSLFKEDVLTLSPLLLVLQWWRARTMRDVARPSAVLIGATAGAGAAWFALRWWLLGAIASGPIGLAQPTTTDIAHNMGRGLWMTFVRIRPSFGRADVPLAHDVISVVLISALLIGAWMWRRGAAPTATLLMGYGAATALAFNVLVSIASSPTRYQFIAMGAVLFLAGVVAALTSARIATAAAIVVVLSLSAAARANISIYRACSVANIQLDIVVRDWFADNARWQNSWVLRWFDVKSDNCIAGGYIPIADAIPDVLRDVREGKRQ